MCKNEFGVPLYVLYYRLHPTLKVKQLPTLGCFVKMHMKIQFQNTDALH